MKLRNKKTGKVFDVIVREKSNGDGKYSIIVCNLRAIRSARSVSSILGEYDTLAKFNEDWEDHKPAEPLIKDEKMRKAVRTWAEANEDTRFYYNRPTIEICINNKAGYVIRSIKFKPEFREYIDIKSGYYTITELCGEKEE